MKYYYFQCNQKTIKLIVRVSLLFFIHIRFKSNTYNNKWFHLYLVALLVYLNSIYFKYIFMRKTSPSFQILRCRNSIIDLQIAGKYLLFLKIATSGKGRIRPMFVVICHGEWRYMSMLPDVSRVVLHG